MKTIVYEYDRCSTCRKALKFLIDNDVDFEKRSIVENPPSHQELKRMLKSIKDRGGSFKNLFNTSGLQYREQKIGDKIRGGMTETEALALLSKNGKLIKRPFLLTSHTGTIGFDPAEWKKIFIS